MNRHSDEMASAMAANESSSGSSVSDETMLHDVPSSIDVNWIKLENEVTVRKKHDASFGPFYVRKRTDDDIIDFEDCEGVGANPQKDLPDCVTCLKCDEGECELMRINSLREAHVSCCHIAAPFFDAGREIVMSSTSL